MLLCQDISFFSLLVLGANCISRVCLLSLVSSSKLPQIIPHLPDTWITQRWSSNSSRITSPFLCPSGMCIILQKPTALLASCCLSLSADVIELEVCHMNEDLWFGHFLEFLKRNFGPLPNSRSGGLRQAPTLTSPILNSPLMQTQALKSKPSHYLFHSKTPWV